MADRNMRLNVGLTQHPDHAAHVANIIAIWNATEDVCMKMLAIFTSCNLDQASLMLGALQNSKARLDVIRAAGEYALTNSPRLKEFSEYMGFLGDRLQKRNKYAHGLYGINEKNQLCILNRRFNWLESDKGSHHVSLDDLKQEWEKGVEAFNRSTNLYEALWNDLPPELAQTLMKIWSLRMSRGQPNPEVKAPHSPKAPQDPPESSQG